MSNQSSLDLARTYTSFSGVDIRVVIGGKPIGQMQAVSYAVQREKAPIYVMGKVDPLSFSRGKRGIAGTMISLMLDRHILFDEPFSDKKYLADKDEIFADVQDINALNLNGSSETENPLNLNDLTGNVNGTQTSVREDALDSDWELTNTAYVDQLPPFDTTIIAVNEYGKAAQMRIYGCEILNEGSGFSIDDIVIENQMTYVCRTLLPWQRMGSWDMSGGQLSNSYNPEPRD